jgi:hypothetical protein
MKFVIAGIIAVLLILFGLNNFFSIPYETAVYNENLQPQNQPQQRVVDQPQFKDDFHKNVSFTPRATYFIDARLLSKKKYYKGQEAKTIPWDFALGWGVMSNPNTLQDLKIKQTLRFYLYSWGPGYTTPQTEIRDNSANCHLIPANKNLLNVIKKIRKGNTLRISGMLVDVSFEGKRPYVWKTSLVRNDDGAGACETVYVKSIVWNGKVYK